MSIWITGDIHGNPSRLSSNVFPEGKELTKDDYVIILGDFVLIWDSYGENKEEKYWLNWLEDKPFTTLFIDGNHENFNRLNEYPVKEWNGGKVHEIRPSVLHLMRGEIFNIHDKKFFTFGGAISHDTSDGILYAFDPNLRHKIYELKRQGKYMYRIDQLNWWKEEQPSKEEMQNGLSNLEKENYKVDFVLTHTPPASVVALLGYKNDKEDYASKYLEDIRYKLDYKYWLCGHMHKNQVVNDKDILLYEQITRIL